MDNLIIEFFQTIEGYLGVSDYIAEGTWVWDDLGIIAPYTNWNTGEPNGGTGANCARMALSGKWQDDPCSRMFLFVETYTAPIMCERLIWI